MIDIDHLAEGLSILKKLYPREIWASQPPSDWKGPFVLPEELLRFYEIGGPINANLAAFENYYLPSLSSLWKLNFEYLELFKEGGSTYANKLLMIECGGHDVFLIDISSYKCPVFSSPIDSLKSSLPKVSLTLGQFLHTFAICLEEFAKYRYDMFDHNRDYLRKEIADKLMAHWTNILGAEEMAINFAESMGCRPPP